VFLGEGEMRVALFIIILLLGVIISELEIISATRPISLLGVLIGIGWAGLLSDYFINKKK